MLMYAVHHYAQAEQREQETDYRQIVVRVQGTGQFYLHDDLAHAVLVINKIQPAGNERQQEYHDGIEFLAAQQLIAGVHLFPVPEQVINAAGNKGKLQALYRDFRLSFWFLLKGSPAQYPLLFYKNNGPSGFGS